VRPFHLVIPGRPATKKNRGIPIAARSKAGRSYVKILPNAEYRAWEVVVKQHAFLQCRGQMPRIAQPVELSATFYEHPTQRGDLGGYFDALCDALEHCEVLANDRYVRATGTMKVLRDRENPRVEVVLVALEDAA
jgi:Holliday junction resolvase RusA-like endonuclease